MKNKVTYINNKIKSTIALATGISLTLFTGSSINRSYEDSNLFDTKKASDMSICDIDVYNYKYCNNPEEFLSFIDEDGNVLQTSKMTGDDLTIYIPSDTYIVESASMGVNVEVPKIDNDEVKYTIELDYKNSFLGVRAKVLDKSK
jgi:hypothetical protein